MQLKNLLKAVIKILLSAQYFIHQILKSYHMGGCTKKLAQYLHSVLKFTVLFALKFRKVLFNGNIKL